MSNYTKTKTPMSAADRAKYQDAVKRTATRNQQLEIMAKERKDEERKIVAQHIVERLAKFHGGLNPLEARDVLSLLRKGYTKEQVWAGFTVPALVSLH